METDPSPRLRTVSKSVAAFPLNEFPPDFAHLLGKELVYLLAAKGKPDLEGSEWEAIFATCIGADWKPSNVGLDDVVMGNTAWGAKSVKSTRPSAQKQVRLISGRNSPVYSFDEKIDTRADPGLVGKLVLDIWNERVSAVRERFKHLRTVVLVKSDDLTEVVVFEFETIRFDPELFRWEWNKNHNLTGHDRRTGAHRFTWQPHGSQFTVVEEVPARHLVVRVRQPERLDKEQVLRTLGFDKTWVSVEQKAT